MRTHTYPVYILNLFITITCTTQEFANFRRGFLEAALSYHEKPARNPLHKHSSIHTTVNVIHHVQSRQFIETTSGIWKSTDAVLNGVGNISRQRKILRWVQAGARLKTTSL